MYVSNKNDDNNNKLTNEVLTTAKPLQKERGV